MFKILTTLLFSIIVFTAAGQQRASVFGTIKDDSGKPISGAEIYIVEQNSGTLSNVDGYYELSVPANTNLSVVFKYLGFLNDTVRIKLSEEQRFEISPKLEVNEIMLKPVEIEDRVIRENAGTIKVDVKNVTKIPTPLGGIEGALVTQGLGVSSTNEMSSSYSVRGGNYDENLIYVNDFEIYRPFLIRSGQNEGMSFINADMVQSVEFSSGGFQARYGDKMSSVLDVKYKKPKEFGGSVSASLLGVSTHLEGATKNEKFTFLLGFRQRSNQYLLNSLQTKGQYVPLFIDIQSYMTYKINKKNEIEWIINYARNRFVFSPEELVTTFGAINQVYQLRMAFEGSENDRYQTFMNGLSWNTKVNSNLRLKWMSSVYRTEEIEAYDIYGDYFLGEVETDFSKDDFGQAKYALGVGALHRYARNSLKTMVANAEHRGYFYRGFHQLQWGIKYQREQIIDKLNEWELLDSAGYSLPYFHYNDTVVELDRVLKSSFNLNSNRYSGFFQDSWRLSDVNNITLTYGLRFTYWDVNKEFVVSPRIQFSYKPKTKRDVVIRASAGMYQQPPFYREMRNLQGIVNLNLKSQKSIHFVAGTDFNFKAWNRNFKFVSEVYYKYLYDQVPYEFDNVLIRYFGQNRSKGYATGVDFRLHGEFVKGTDSYISVSVMSSKEDLKDDSYVQDSQVIYPGMIPRPTDQRVKFAMYFEDYIPRLETFRMHLNLIVATGLPFGPPDGERYRDILRIPPYRRLDIGFSALLFDRERREMKNPKSFMKNFESIWLTAEVWNLLGVQNTISYLWIKDISNTVWAVPNVLSARRFNVRLIVKF
jgi:outer membrane receptor protein involved in Fe transport